ncbi:MAG: Membrane protein insertase YidC [candidate division TM6 bacterium GW2011_GWE2_41_16]|nr:MAG: Membrane protein insertase YidC [candidate division TM6 bacterium GW2011_GWE2_41_16]
MKIQELLLFFVLALSATWIVQYFLGKPASEQAPKAGQSVKVMSTQEAQKPLAREIDFFDAHVQQAKNESKPNVQTVDYNSGSAVFSSYAGALASFTSTIFSPRNQQPLNTFDFTFGDGFEDKCFVVALDMQTPLVFDLVSNQKDEHATTLVYRSTSPYALVEKKFVVNNKIHKIDVTLTIDPHAGADVQPRIFVPTPLLKDATDAAVNDAQGLTYTDRNTVEQIAKQALKDKAWVAPTLFGVESRYGICALVTDSNAFVRRGYFSTTTNGNVSAILEGPAVKQKTSWNMSFYCGPRERDAMVAVDARLEKTLHSGWTSWITWLLVYVLTWLYNLVGNFGWAIILLAVLIRLLLLPLTIKGDRAMKASQKKSQDLERRLRAVNEKYQDDKVALAQAKAEVYRQASPGFDFFYSMLPNIIMIVLFLALQRVLGVSIYLYKAPFILFYKDLSMADPYAILPVLMGVSILVNSLLITPLSKKNIRQLMFSIFIALLVPGLMMRFSVGTILFLVTFNLLQFAQTLVTKKFFKAA